MPHRPGGMPPAHKRCRPARRDPPALPRRRGRGMRPPSESLLLRGLPRSPLLPLAEVPAYPPSQSDSPFRCLAVPKKAPKRIPPSSHLVYHMRVHSQPMHFQRRSVRRFAHPTKWSNTQHSLPRAKHIPRGLAEAPEHIRLPAHR